MVHVYTVRLVNNDNVKYLDNKYLREGMKYFRKGSARGEYGERFSDIVTRFMVSENSITM